MFLLFVEKQKKMVKVAYNKIETTEELVECLNCNESFTPVQEWMKICGGCSKKGAWVCSKYECNKVCQRVDGSKKHYCPEHKIDFSKPRCQHIWFNAEGEKKHCTNQIDAENARECSKCYALNNEEWRCHNTAVWVDGVRTSCTNEVEEQKNGEPNFFCKECFLEKQKQKHLKEEAQKKTQTEEQKKRSLLEAKFPPLPVPETPQQPSVKEVVEEKETPTPSKKEEPTPSQKEWVDGHLEFTATPEVCAKLSKFFAGWIKSGDINVAAGLKMSL